MLEYTSGREIEKFETIRKSSAENAIINKYFANTRITPKSEEGELNNRVVNHCTFMNMGLKEWKVDKVDFSHCVFVDCYFKYASFSHVNFTNCKFIKCNFEDVNLISSNFKYASFHECFVHYDNIKGCLPTEENLRWRLCTNLSLECLRLGNDAQFREFYFAEKVASEKHYLAMFTKKDSYYKKHYSSWQSIEGLLKYISSRMSKRLWGYGEKISYLVINMFIVIFLFASIYFFSGEVFKTNGTATTSSISAIDSLYLSACNFITVTSDITTSDEFVRNLTTIEGFMGVLLMGFFVAALFRYINRR